LAILVNRDI
jgi:hypothetical protein